MAEKEDYTKDVGPTGPTGATGATGATGETGPPGTTTWAGITDKPAELAYLTGVTSGIQAQINAFIGLFEIDINGDAQPVTASVSDQYYEVDANNDIMPQAA